MRGLLITRGGGGRSIDPSHIFADAAARDAYFPTHLNELREAQTEIILLDNGSGDAIIQLWLGSTNPASYSATNNWLTEGATLTGEEIKTLLFALADTNNFNDAYQAILDLFTNTTDELQLSKDFYAPSIRSDTGSLFLDQALKISGNSQGIDILDQARNQRAELIMSKFDATNGSSKPIYNELAALDTFDVHLTDDEQATSFSTIFPSINSVKWERFIVKPRAAGDGVFMMRFESSSGEPLVSMFTVTFEASDIGNETEFMLLSAANLTAGENFHISYTGPALAGHQYSGDATWGDQFVIFARTMSYPRTEKEIALVEDIPTGSGENDYVDSVAFDDDTNILTLGRTDPLSDLTADLSELDQDNYVDGARLDNQNLIIERTGTLPDITVDLSSLPSGTGSYAAPSVHNLSTNIPSRVDLNTDLNQSYQFTFDISNRLNISRIDAIVTGGDNVQLTNPTADGTQTQSVTLSGIDSTTSQTISILLRITDTQNNTHDSNTVTVLIQNAQTHEQTHFGFIASTEDQTNIDFTNDDIEARDDAFGNWVVANIPTTGLHRIYFAVPTTDTAITRISQSGFTLYDSALTSGNQFTAINNFTIAGNTYNVLLMLVDSAVNSSYNGQTLTTS